MDNTILRRTLRAAYTLTEMMIVLIIIAVLVTLAINQFYGPREQALEREAVANLKLIAAAEKIYRMEVGSYVSAGSTTDLNNQLSLMLPEQNPKWVYKVDSSVGTVFTAKAGRMPVNNPTLCINQSVEDPYKSGCSW